MFGVMALFSLAVTVAAAWAYRCARRALAARLVHEFAYILDAIDDAIGAGVELVSADSAGASVRQTLLPAERATPTASWPLLLGLRRAAIAGSFLEAAHVLDGLAKGTPGASHDDAKHPDATFAGGARLVTTLGDRALLSLRDVLSHRRGRNQTIRA